MTLALTIFALIAGSALGAVVVLALYLRAEINRRNDIDRERMLWANKVLVRQGQMPVFTPEMLGEDRPQVIHQPPMQVTSPFRSGLADLKKQVKESKGVKLPPEVKERIEKEAEARRMAG